MANDEELGKLAAMSAQERMQRSLEKEGLSLDIAAKKIKQGMNSKTSKPFINPHALEVLDAGGKVVSILNPIIYSKGLHDRRMILDYTKLFLSIMGALPNDKVDLNHSGAIEFPAVAESVKNMMEGLGLAVSDKDKDS